jgi:hypothetical protein
MINTPHYRPPQAYKFKFKFKEKLEKEVKWNAKSGLLRWRWKK